MGQSQPQRALLYSALLAVQVLFGINYVVSKVVVDAFPPLVWASARIIVATLVMLAAAAAFRWEHRPRGGWRFFGPLVVFALLGSVINQASFLVGLKYTTATNSAVLNTLIPVFTLLIVTLRGQEPLTARSAAGFLLALSGVLVIRRVEEISLSNRTALGDLLTILNCLSYGLFLSYSKSFLERHDRVWATAWLFAYGSVGLTALAMPGWAAFSWPAVTPALLGAMAFAIIGGTLLTYFLSIWTLSYLRSSSVAIFVYLQPVVAATLAWLWMGDAPTPRTIAASLLIFGGVLLALSPRRQRASAAIPDRQ